MALVQCKECGTEISSAATACPKCGAPQAQPSRMERHQAEMREYRKGFLGRFVRKMLIAAVVAVAVLGYVAWKGDSPNSSPQVSSTSASGPASDAPQVNHIGDTVKTDHFEITILSVKTMDSVPGPLGGTTPAQGGVYVAVKWQYKNIGSKPVGMFSTPSLHLVDPNGTSYDPDIDASGSYAAYVDATAKLVSDVNPGITIKDGDVFEVSKKLYDPQTWQLKVKADSDYLVALTAPGAQPTSTSTPPAAANASAPTTAQARASAPAPKTQASTPAANASGTPPSPAASQAPGASPPGQPVAASPQGASAQATVFRCVSPKYTILVDQAAGAQGYRYRSWNKPKSTADTPDLTLVGGTSDTEGTGACASTAYDFKKGNLDITLTDNVSCTETAPPSGSIGDVTIVIAGQQRGHFYCSK